MRYFLLITISMLFTACSAHTTAVSRPAIKADASCATQRCEQAKIPWQETLRRNSMGSDRLAHITPKVMNAAETEQIVRKVYQRVMASTDYHADIDVYGRFDLYPTPAELEKSRRNNRYRGDCTTFSHLFYYQLIEHGIHPSRIFRVRMDTLHRQGPVTNHMVVVVDNTWLLDSNEPNRQVVHFSTARATPKMWLTETQAGWYPAAQGNTPLRDTRFKGFSMAMF